MPEHLFDIVSKILPLNCEAYLKNKGWQETGKINTSAKIFSNEHDDGHVVDVLMPSKLTFVDSTSLILNLLQALQDFEGRPLEYIANDIVLSKYDVFRIIAFKGDTTASLPLVDASKLFNSGLSLMASAAQSLLTQQPYFQSWRPVEVAEFLSKLRMGHTERGSCVLTLQTPIVPNMVFQGTSETALAEEPFERQVTTRLCSLISDATTIATEPDSEALTQSVSHGMSANFFESLADITSACGDTHALLDMTWASIRPIQQTWNIPSTFTIKREIVDHLREAGRVLKTRVPEIHVEITGFVTTLRRETGAGVGTIKINDVTSVPQRLITIENLPADKYTVAVDAHQHGKVVIVKGDLYKSTRIQTMSNITEFKSIDEYFT